MSTANTEKLSHFQVRELGSALALSIVDRAAGSDQFRPWTKAVYDALKTFGAVQGWTIHPKEEVCRGEYLCDFMLFEYGYGCRLACESQWHHGIRDHQNELNWAFEKLLGVKSDIKLFILEGTEDHWQAVQDKYLYGYAQLSTEETFLSLRWYKDKFYGCTWKPKHAGVQQPGEVQFEAL